MFSLKRRTREEAVFDGINVLFMLLLCFITLYPIWYVLVNSFNDGADAMRGGIFWLPRIFTLDNYATVLHNDGIIRSMGISVSKTILGACVHVFFTAMVAYALSRNELIGRKLYILIGTITLFFGGGLIPSYLLIRDLHLIDNYLVYIIPAMFSFFNLIIFLSFFREIPDGLEEAARIDGANDFAIFTRIIIPVSMPVIATIALFSGVGQWNDYFTGVIYINNEKLLPIQTVLYKIIAEQGSSRAIMAAGITVDRHVSQQSVKLATMVVAGFPIVVAYPFLQKYFVKGLMIGSLKG